MKRDVIRFLYHIFSNYSLVDKGFKFFIGSSIKLPDLSRLQAAAAEAMRDVLPRNVESIDLYR